MLLPWINPRYQKVINVSVTYNMLQDLHVLMKKSVYASLKVQLLFLKVFQSKTKKSGKVMHL